jgi:hypothetical protein
MFGCLMVRGVCDKGGAPPPWTTPHTGFLNYSNSGLSLMFLFFLRLYPSVCVRACVCMHACMCVQHRGEQAKQP